MQAGSSLNNLELPIVKTNVKRNASLVHFVPMLIANQNVAAKINDIVLKPQNSSLPFENYD